MRRKSIVGGDRNSENAEEYIGRMLEEVEEVENDTAEDEEASAIDSNVSASAKVTRLESVVVIFVVVVVVFSKSTLDWRIIFSSVDEIRESVTTIWDDDDDGESGDEGDNEDDDDDDNDDG